MNQQCIEEYYNLKVTDIKLLDKHFGTEIYKINTDIGKFIVKVFPMYFDSVGKEGAVVEYLSEHGLYVAELMKTRSNEYAVITPNIQFTVQQYIDGNSPAINSAPEWLMNKSADFLGRTVSILSNYPELSVRFDQSFFAPESVLNKKAHYEQRLTAAREDGNVNLIPLWEEQIKHLDRIKSFHIDTEKLTYANSHGDYHIGQIIEKNHDITVVDWTSVCRLPICLEIITSYVFASPSCADGTIDADGLISYIGHFTKHFPLGKYDIKAMPFVLYFWHCMCNYRPDELADMPYSYRPIAELINKVLRWLYKHVEEVSKELDRKYRILNIQ